MKLSRKDRDTSGTPTYRSKFEARVAALLPPGTEYEPVKFTYPIADPGYRCGACGSKDVERNTSYTPDFRLPNGTFIEAKGRLTGANRRRLVAWKANNPTVVLRIVFMADNWLSKGAKSRYSDWAKKAGFQYTVGTKVPGEWLK